MSSGGEALGEVLYKVNRKWVMALVVGIVLVLVVRKIMAPELAVHEGMAAPEFALEATDGRVFTLAQLQGVSVILSFWGTDCPDCISELAGKSEFARAHPEVELLGIAVDSGDLDTLAAAKDELGISYPVLEADSAVKASYGIENLPVTLLVDDQGIIRKVQEGKISRQSLSVWIR